MPRPGPRPYECIRRAWHSESHQALRGSLTQEIFRIVTEIHSPETRSKKEWQEKLPIVVLRAEEILYSKARTEAEYTDVSTLKTRLEDAVNTMIRRTDENKEKEEELESGVFMEPCVEAALSLGCLPKMNPRGQRSCPSRMSGSSTVRRTTSSTTPSGSPSPTSSLGGPSSTVTQTPSAYLTMAPKPFVPPVQVQVSSVPGMLEQPRMNVPPCYANQHPQQQQQQLQQQQQQQQQQTFKYAGPFGLEVPQLSPGFRLRDQGSLPASLVCVEDFHPRPGALAGVMGNLYAANPRFQHVAAGNIMPPTLRSPGAAASSGMRQREGEHDLELCLGPPRVVGAGGSGKGQFDHAGEMQQSSSSSSGSMSWQSTEGVPECSKRKALAWSLGASTGEVAKRHKDFLF